MESALIPNQSNGRLGLPVDSGKESRLHTTSTTTPPRDQEHQRHDNEDETTVISPTLSSPPYWVQSHSRSFSNISVESVAPGGITLKDNTDGDDAKNQACWAKSAYIEDHVVINGSRTGIGAFVVWNITVETLHGGTMRVRKRYSEFDDLRQKLLQTFPLSEGAMPPLPPKSVISKFRPKFLEHRRIGLSYFLNCILLNPEFSGSPVLKEFLFS